MGNSHSYVLSSAGTVFAAGYNGNGQLGNGTTFSTSLFRPVAGLGRIIAIAAGANHGLALREDRTVAAWGYNAGGQLGSGVDSNSERNYVEVAGLTNVIAIAAGEYHSLALKQDGTVWAWGLNVDGQIGQGTTTTSRYLTPVQVKGIGGAGFLTGVTAIAAGNRHNLAVLVDGSVVAWGSNTSGQLGINSTTPTSSPTAISGLTNILAVAAGGAHSLALKNDATVMAWGDNAFGQVGDGSTTNRLTPTAIAGLTQVGRIAAGATHSIAIKTGGVLYTWGNNANRQLDYAESGQTATPSANRTAPTLVPSVTNVFAIAAGGRHSSALCTNGQAFQWGDNFFGQLGNKSGNFSPHSGNLNLLRGDAGIAAFAGNVVTSVGGSSTSGTAIVDVNGLATGYDFGNLTPNPMPAPTIDGAFKNNDLTQVVSGVDVTVENGGGNAFSVQKLACNSALNANEECAFRVTFNPNLAGDYSGNLKVIADLPGSPEVRTLFGKAIAPASPGLKVTATGTTTAGGYLLFASQTVGSTGTAQNITIQNVGTATLTVSSAAISAGAADFSLPMPAACASVSAGMSCNLPVVFSPAGPNIRDGAVTLTTNAGDAVITLQGVADSTTDPILTTAIAGTGSGTITGSGINCPGDCSQTYTAGTMVTLTQMANGGSTFTGWSGACTGNGACTVTMNAAKSVTATFNTGSYAVTGTASPMAGGSVACTSPVNYGSTSSCMVNTNAGYTLTNISGCGGTPGTTSPYTTGPVTAACTVTATYTQNSYLLTLAKSGTGSGTVTSAPAGINCGATCSSSFTHGTMITLTATPTVGSTFSGWSGAGCSGTGTCVVTLTVATTVTAGFVLSATAPNPPTIGTATAGNTQITVIFTAPMNDGGSPILDYTATCGSQSATGTLSPITVMGLTNGTPYTCTVTARNAIGSSMTSSPSNSVTPSAPTINILSAASRKNHDTAGNHSLPITLGQPITGNITIEPRDGRRGHTLVVTFDQTIVNPGTVTITDAASQSIGTPTLSYAGNIITLHLGSIPDNRRVSVAFSGVNGFGKASLAIGFLVGDVNGSGKVNGADISAIKTRAASTPVNGTNFLFDLDQSGKIDSADVTMAKVRAGWAIQ